MRIFILLALVLGLIAYPALVYGQTSRDVSSNTLVSKLTTEEQLALAQIMLTISRDTGQTEIEVEDIISKINEVIGSTEGKEVPAQSSTTVPKTSPSTPTVTSPDTNSAPPSSSIPAPSTIPSPSPALSNLPSIPISLDGLFNITSVLNSFRQETEVSLEQPTPTPRIEQPSQPNFFKRVLSAISNLLSGLFGGSAKAGSVLLGTRGADGLRAMHTLHDKILEWANTYYSKDLAAGCEVFLSINPGQAQVYNKSAEDIIDLIATGKVSVRTILSAHIRCPKGAPGPFDGSSRSLLGQPSSGLTQ